MSDSGPSEQVGEAADRSARPQPEHSTTTHDEITKRAQFRDVDIQGRVATSTRGVCCSSARCGLCPGKAKFTTLNGLQHLIAHSIPSIATGVRVNAWMRLGSLVRRVHHEARNGETAVAGELIMLGANAIQSVAMLLATGHLRRSRRYIRSDASPP
jgi:hypothetical protein